MLNIRLCEKKDFIQLAEMKWLHCKEDDMDYGENNIKGADKQKFISEFIEFLNQENEYKIFVTDEDDVIVSAMFVYVIPKVPKPNLQESCIAYLTNVFTKKEYRNKNIGTKMLEYIKNYLTKLNCELIIVYPSQQSINWYIRNGFSNVNEVFECKIIDK